MIRDAGKALIIAAAATTGVVIALSVLARWARTDG